VKRIKFLEAPVEIEEGSLRIENNLSSKKVHDSANFTQQDALLLEKVGRGIDLRDNLKHTLNQL
jgi:hypothetical protein